MRRVSAVLCAFLCVLAVAFCVVAQHGHSPESAALSQQLKPAQQDAADTGNAPSESADETQRTADQAAGQLADQQANQSDGQGHNIVIDPQPIEAEHDPDTVIVGIADGVTLDQVNERLATLDYVATKSVSEDDVFYGYMQLDLAEGVRVEDAVARLEVADFTSAAQPNYIYHLMDTVDSDDATLQSATIAGGLSATLTALTTTINDARASEQWALDAIHARDAWDYKKTNQAITVAVLDTGAKLDHPDLQDNIVNPYSTKTDSAQFTDTHGHGTHVAGIIAAVANNNVGVAGVSYNAKIMPVQISTDGSADTPDIVKAANYVADFAEAHPEANIRVLNLSFGGYYADDDLVDTSVTTALQRLEDDNILVVCAAGNYADRNPHQQDGKVYADGQDHAYRCIPCDLDPSIVGVVNVAKTESDGTVTYDRAKGSNFNTSSASMTKDMAAPGSSILSTSRTDGYVTMSGTSMAAPCVAGVAALVFAVDPTLTPAQAQSILHDTAQDINAEGPDLETGYGMVDALAAVKAAGAPKLSGASALAKGATTQLAVTYEFGTPAWSWASSNTSIASVSSSGIVKGEGAGTATITVQSGDLGASFDVSVYDSTISGTDTVEYGSSITLSVPSGNPANASWQWSSTGNNVALNTTTGLVAGLALGPADITVTLTSPEVVGDATATKRVTVVQADLAGATVSGVEDQVYAGEQTSLPNLKVTMPGWARSWGGYQPTTKTLMKGTDYDVVYDLGDADGTKTTTATYTIRGKGNYTGEVSGMFEVGANTIGDSQVSATKVRYTYTGKPITLEGLKVVSADGEELVEGRDYTVSYSDNVDVGDGSAYVTVTGINRFVGEVTRRFYIDAMSITSEDVTLDASGLVDKTYTGSAITQDLKLTYNGMTLVEGTDYQIVYLKGTTEYSTVVTAADNVGVRVYGLGNYYTTTTTYIMGFFPTTQRDYRDAATTFNILPAPLQSLVLTPSSYTYDGTQKTPSVAVKGVNGTTLVEGRDYTLTVPAGRTEVGTYTYVATGKGNYSGTAQVVLEVKAAPVVPDPGGNGGNSGSGGGNNPGTGGNGSGGGSEGSGNSGGGNGNGSDSGNNPGGNGGSGTGGNGSGGNNGDGAGGNGGSGTGGNGSGGDTGDTGDAGGGVDDIAACAGYAAKSGLTDLDPNDWYMQVGEGKGSFPGTNTLYLDFTLSKGIMQGYSGSTLFGPNAFLTRAEGATILYRLANPDSVDTTDPAHYATENTTGMSDVETGKFYTAAVNWCVKNGVITGFKYDGYALFKPYDNITREQIATIVARYCTVYLGGAEASADIAGYSDFGRISEWARSGVSYCKAKGVMSGYGGSGAFGPQEQATRAQMSKIIAVAATM